MGFLYSQFFVKPAYPSESFKDKVVIVTGSNTGLGLEAARHIARLDAKKVILAVRNTQAGEEAKQSIEASTKRPGCCEVWKLDLGSYASVKSFAAQAQTLDRLDAVIENAGIAAGEFKLLEGLESSITVNVISTFLLAVLLLPKLQATATATKTKTRLTIVSSEVHGWCKFPERACTGGILEDMSSPHTTTMDERYPASKLLEVLVVRQIAPLITQGPNKDVILNMLNPGLCQSGLSRAASGLMALQMAVMKTLIARTTEVGSRTLVHSATAGPESHGKFMSDGVVHEDVLADWVKTDEGDKVGAQVWKEVKAKLDEIQPGVTKNIA